MDKLYIVIPAYNEEENIEAVIKDWYPVVESIGNGSKLVIIDDGSKDLTYEKMKKAEAQLDMFKAITKPNSGHGSTILFGYHYGINAGADYIFQTDCDGQTLPEEFAMFWDERKNYDMIIGNRKGRQDGFSRILVTKILKLVIRMRLKVNVLDANTPFRLMKASVLKENISLIPDDYHLSNVIISVIYEKRKLKTKYIPITFRPRQGGVNSINMKRIIRIGRQAFKDFKEINRYIK